MNMLIAEAEARLSVAQMFFERNKLALAKCQAEEDAAWEKRAWLFDELIAWWKLFCDVHSLAPSPPYGLNWLECRFFTPRFVGGDALEIYIPKLPKPVPRKEDAWAMWERVFARP